MKKQNTRLFSYLIGARNAKIYKKLRQKNIFLRAEPDRPEKYYWMGCIGNFVLTGRLYNVILRIARNFWKPGKTSKF